MGSCLQGWDGLCTKGNHIFSMEHLQSQNLMKYTPIIFIYFAGAILFITHDNNENYF